MKIGCYSVLLVRIKAVVANLKNDTEFQILTKADNFYRQVDNGRLKEKNDKKQKNQMDYKSVIARWNNSIDVFRTMAFGEGMDTSVTRYGSRTVR